MTTKPVRTGLEKKDTINATSTTRAASKAGRTRKTDHSTEAEKPTARTRVDAAIVDVLSEGRSMLETAGTVDAVWVDGLTAVVVDTMMTAGSAGVSALESELATFEVELRAREVEEVVSAKLELLRRITQLGAQALIPREAARSIEPKTHAANLLILLDESDSEVFNDVLADQFGLHPTQLSHIMNRLSNLGLVHRTKYGRRASWSLTSAGELAAEQIRERDSSTMPDDAVTATTPAELEDAVHRSADAIEIDTPNAEDAWYVRATLDRMSGADVFGSTQLPFVLFLTSLEDAAYIRGDLAKTLLRFWRNAGQDSQLPELRSGGLTMAGSYVYKSNVEQVDVELEDA